MDAICVVWVMSESVSIGELGSWLLSWAMSSWRNACLSSVALSFFALASTAAAEYMPPLADVMLSMLIGVSWVGWSRGRESQDRKSTRLNSSHANISYAVFCLKKKKT